MRAEAYWADCEKRMNSRLLFSASVLAFLSLCPAWATDAVKGIETGFISYNGVDERCVRISPIPGGDYDKGDIEDETELCELDFYDDKLAVCPKTWATSIGAVIYDITSGPFKGRRREFQEEACLAGRLAKYIARKDLGKLKITMNQRFTSGTFSTSSLLYYHFSRYFDFTAKIPVAVWRNMDAQVFKDEIAEGGFGISSLNTMWRRNAMAWRVMLSALSDPDTYSKPAGFGTPDDIFSADRTKVYGALLDGSGNAYGPEFNGPLDASWGKAGYQALQRTPAYIALRYDGSLSEAIARGIDAMQDLPPAPEGGKKWPVSSQQMAFWMREWSEIALIDFIMSQQDRPGNIDFRAYYYWVENGNLKHVRADDRAPVDGSIPEDAILIRRTRVNDNDAGGRPIFENFARETGMLENLRHFDSKIYTRLMELDADFKSRGAILRWLESSLGLEPADVKMIVDNTSDASAILRGLCERGEMRFDLNPKRVFESGDMTSDIISCRTTLPAPIFRVGPQ